MTIKYLVRAFAEQWIPEYRMNDSISRWTRDIRKAKFFNTEEEARKYETTLGRVVAVDQDIYI